MSKFQLNLKRLKDEFQGKNNAGCVVDVLTVSNQGVALHLNALQKKLQAGKKSCCISCDYGLFALLSIRK